MCRTRVAEPNSWREGEGKDWRRRLFVIYFDKKIYYIWNNSIKIFAWFYQLIFHLQNRIFLVFGALNIMRIIIPHIEQSIFTLSSTLLDCSASVQILLVSLKHEVPAQIIFFGDINIYNATNGANQVVVCRKPETPTSSLISTQFSSLSAYVWNTDCRSRL